MRDTAATSKANDIVVMARALELGAPEPGFSRGAGALDEIQVDLEPVV